jgi:hypothetical protein
MLEAGFNWRHIVEPKAEYTVVARPVEFGQAGVH